MNLLKKLQPHLLSLISLTVAISALSYNTYRNELTEFNRNVRHAGFEVLKELNQLQLLIDHAHYEKNADLGNPIIGWGHVLYIKDMSFLISDHVVDSANQLESVWGNQWASVYENQASNQQITKSIDVLRLRIREEIKALD